MRNGSLRTVPTLASLAMAAGGGGDYCEERIEKFDKAILHHCFAIQEKLLLGMPMLILGMGRWHEYPLEPVVEYLRRYQEKGNTGFNHGQP